MSCALFRSFFTMFWTLTRTAATWNVGEYSYWQCRWSSLILGFRISIHLIRIRIQHFRLKTDSDPGLWWPKLVKNYSWKKIKFFLDQKLQFTFLSQGLHKGRPSYKRILHLSKEDIQHLKTWNFLIFFLLLWVIFALLDPDPLTWLNPDLIRTRILNPSWFQCGSRSSFYHSAFRIRK